MDFETLVSESLHVEPGTAAASNRTGEEIMAEFAPLVEADRKRGADG